MFRDVTADITVLPPIEQGDVLRLLEQSPDVIGIIDGQYFHAPAVLHREILLALERGVRVLGAASLGALRAMELDAFGMEGVGDVFRLYRDGTIDGDDEVAVLHATASEGYRPLTEALVSIRHNIRRAQRREIIAPRTAVGVVAAMKRLHFTRRTYEAMITTVREEERLGLVEFLRHEAVDLKHKDALGLVQTIADRIAGLAVWPPRSPVRVHQTSHFVRQRHTYVGRQVGSVYVADNLVLAFQQVLSPSFRRLYRQVSRRCLAVDEAQHRGLLPEAPARLVERFRHANNPPSDAACDAWLRERSLTDEELIDVLRDRDLEARVLDLYRRQIAAASLITTPRRLVAATVARRIGVSERVLVEPLLMYPGVPWSDPLIRELKFIGKFSRAVDIAAEILRNNAGVFERHPSLTDAPVRRGVLHEFVADRWRVRPERLEAAIRARGFTGYADFAEAARHLLIYEQTSSGTYRPELLTDCFHVNVEARSR